MGGVQSGGWLSQTRPIPRSPDGDNKILERGGWTCGLIRALSRNKVLNHFHPNSIPASRGWSVFEWSRWPCSISRGLCVKINYKINQRPPPAPANCTKAGFTAYSQKLVPNQIKQPAARRETKYSKLGVTTSFGQTKKE